MKTNIATFLLVAAPSVYAQRPSNTSICDYYSSILLGTSNATTQNKLLTLLVNTAVIGNYTGPQKVAVPGILSSNATLNGTKVNLLPYFDGSLKSSNTGKKHGVSVNYLDDGGAGALINDKPANGKTSNQYTLLTHLYAYFGLLLGCSNISQPGFPAYAGDTSMYEVHKYMALDSHEVQYFIQQVGLAATSFGVSAPDVTLVGYTLQGYFGNKCAPKTSIANGTAELQSVCIANDCPVSPKAMCKAYGKVQEPAKNGTMETTAPAHHGSSRGNGMSNSTLPRTNAAGRVEIAHLLAALVTVVLGLCASFAL